jgi:hypothetical protein
MELPDMVRVTVRDSATGEVLSVSRAATVHINAPTVKQKPAADKKEEEL